MFTDEKIDELFTYHAPKPGQAGRHDAIRSAACSFAKLVVANTPQGPDQATAIRKLRECVMTANAAIALE